MTILIILRIFIVYELFIWYNQALQNQFIRYSFYWGDYYCGLMKPANGAVRLPVHLQLNNEITTLNN